MRKQRVLQGIAVILVYLFAGLQPISAQEIREVSEGLTGVNSGGADLADFDKDGDADVLITGKDAQGKPVTRVYENKQGEGFSPVSGANLTNVWLGDAKWGDYNRDGYPDILISGATQPSSPYAPVTKLYKNNGNGTFSELGGNKIAGLFGSSVAWGDFNKNGSLDFLITGKNANGLVVTKLYSNKGGSFQEIPGIQLPGVWMGDAAFGDYDGDGDLDIAISGQSAKGRPVSFLIANKGNMNFQRAGNVNLEGLSYSSVSWTDYDRNGHMDLLLTGKNVGNVPATILYKNTGSGNLKAQRNIEFTGVMTGSASWGHFDKNGYKDLLVNGRSKSGAGVAKIYKNFGSGFGRVKTVNMPAVRYSNSAWFNGTDGWTILLTGQVSGNKSITRIYQLVSSRKAEFVVKDAETETPVKGAGIQVNDEKLSTNAQGKTEITLKKGAYPYQVKASGYLVVQGELNIDNKAVSETVLLKPVRKLILELKNAHTQKPVAGAKVKIGESLVTSNKQGIARLDTFTGNYPCVIKSPGYVASNTDIALNKSRMEKSITLTPKYSIELSLKDAHSKKPVRNATLKIGDHTVQADEKGIATIDTTNGEYIYSIDAEGYQKSAGTIRLNNTDEVKFVRLTPLYPVHLKLQNADSKEPLAYIEMKIADKTYTTNQDGVLALDTLSGSYQVSASPFMFKSLVDTIQVDNQEVNRTFRISPTYKAVFVVIDGDKNPIKGASIEVNGRTIETNLGGMAAVDLTKGEYKYRVSIGGDTYSTQKFTIKDSGVRLKFIAN